MFCREHIERIVKDVFTSYGGSCLDTPVFERKDVLTDKYGEDSKLIFDLMDQGGEQLALRYDHTVPLARYIAMSGATIQGKIWQVGKVYRRDNPVMSKGRMREFMQAVRSFLLSYRSDGSLTRCAPGFGYCRRVGSDDSRCGDRQFALYYIDAVGRG